MSGDTGDVWRAIGKFEARIDAQDKTIASLTARLAKVEKGGGGNGASSQSRSGGEVASDDDLDGPYGDPAVRKDPPKWIKEGGDSFAGQNMSACPSAYLISLAGFYDWQADKDDEAGARGETYTNKKTGAQVAKDGGLRRRDAARARGWARRNASAPAARPAAQPAFAEDYPEEPPF